MDEKASAVICVMSVPYGASVRANSITCLIQGSHNGLSEPRNHDDDDDNITTTPNAQSKKQKTEKQAPWPMAVTSSSFVQHRLLLRTLPPYLIPRTVLVADRVFLIC